jgi:hypothetical protein
MTDRPTLALLLALAAPLALAACGDEVAEEKSYEAGVEDVGGGELIVTEADAEGVEDLELPETPMTPVPPGAEPAATATATATAAPPAE